MTSLNINFLEEFKHLDKLCREIYRSEKGVTSYIEDMKSVPTSESRYIPNWDDDLNALVRLRHLRNNLSHEEGSLYEDVCTQADAEWINAFYSRILNQSDPLALLTRKRAEKPAGCSPRPQYSAPLPATAKAPKRPAGCFFVFIALLCVSFLLLLLVVFIVMRQNPEALFRLPF